jgi:hypothetical protein
MTNSLFALILILFIGYGLVEAWPLIAGPALSVDLPPDHGVSHDGIVTVMGSSARIATLTLDGATLLRDEAGGFSSVLTFPPGGSILTFVATDRFGRSVTETRSLFVSN